MVNLILKKRSSGGTVLVTGGRRFNTQGDTYDYSVNIGLPLFDKGYVNLTFDKQYSNFVQLGGADSRVDFEDCCGQMETRDDGVEQTAFLPAGVFGCA